MIELEHITVALPPGKPRAKTILDDITLAIERGDWIALVGTNGSGKTTMLQTLAGLIPLSAGTMRYRAGPDGRVGTRDPLKPSIALLLQEPDDQFVTSRVQNELLVSLPPEVSDEAAAAKIAAAVDKFSLSAFLDRNPHRLSGGEKQRLALATVWLADPQLLLLDEPTSYLDWVERNRCTAFVQSLNEAGVTVIWATPGGEELLSAGRVLYIDGGRIRFDGDYPAFGQMVRGERLDILLPSPELKDTARAVPSGEGAASAPRGSAGPIVSLAGVSFGYGDVSVFDAISARVSPGECIGVTGRNGSGKSTLLGLMSGVLEPTAGEIHRSYSRVVERSEQNVFYLFQNPERLFFAETVFEEVAFGLRALGIPRSDIARIVSRTLARVGLPPETFLDRMPFTLSFGEMRRLAFAIAVALRPKFLLLDEPASCLDASGRSLLVGLIDEFKTKGTAVVVAAHDPAGLDHVVDRWIAL